jgi:Big-like domain-containing protein
VVGSSRRFRLAWLGPVLLGLSVLPAFVQSPGAAGAPPDNINPRLTFTAPAAGVASGNVAWSATASDQSGIHSVEFLVDGAVVEADRSAPYRGWWDTTRDFGGIHQIHVRAYDAFGNSTVRGRTVRVARLSPPLANDAGSFGVVGSDLLRAFRLGRQIHEKNRSWSAYAGADAPEGGFMGSMGTRATELPATITLPLVLQPGRHFFFVKGFNYGDPISVKLSIGGAETILATDDRDATGIWSISAPLTLRRASNQLSLTLRKGAPQSRLERFLLQGMYVTANATEAVLADDTAIDLNYPTRMDHSAPRPGNVIENSSFETGLGHGWGLSENRQFSLRSIWDHTQGQPGRASVRLPLDPDSHSHGDHISLVSKVYAVRPNKRYTLSAWLKTDPGATAEGSMALVNSFSNRELLPAWAHQPQRVERRFSVGSNWTKVSVTGYLLDYPTADYLVDIAGAERGGGHLWIDGVSLTEGAPTGYSPRLLLEIGLRSSQPSNLYYEDEPVVFELRAANASPTQQADTVRFEVYDYMNRKVKDGSLDVSVAPSTTAVRTIGLGVGRRGSFRALMWIDGREGSEEEVLFGVVPRPQVIGADPGSAMGIHSNFLGFQYATLQKLGIKWDRAMSPGAFFRWNLVEPVDDQIAWFDSRIDAARRHGVQIIGTIGEGSWPSWADSGGMPNLAEWQEYVDQLVDHYRGRVQAWEIWNEPNYSLRPDFYARMVKRAADAIERSDPSAGVVAMGGSSDPNYVASVIAELERQYPRWPWRDKLDAISMHMYPPTETAVRDTRVGPAGKFRNDVLRVYREPIWNTEGGHWDSGFFHTSNAPSVLWGRALFPFRNGYLYTESAPLAVENVSINFIETIGNGLRKYFYYDFRTAPSPSLLRNHPSALEYDDTVRPKGIVLSVLARLLDHSKGLGRLVTADDATQAYLFDRRGTPLIALYCRDNASRSVALRGVAPQQIKVYDVMGNVLPVNGTTVQYGRQPVYLEGQGLGLEALKSGFEQGVIRNRADTLAPNLTINRGPRGTVPPGNPVRLRWGATDDTYTPGPADPNAITYSYRVDGSPRYIGWSSWSADGHVDLAGLAPGRYVFQVIARDGAGNASPWASRAFAISPAPEI